MSKFKNFEIEREVLSTKVRVSDIKVGDVFERQGSLHMKVHMYDVGLYDSELRERAVCNLNTGSCWVLDKDEEVLLVHRAKFSYTVEV